MKTSTIFLTATDWVEFANDEKLNTFATKLWSVSKSHKDAIINLRSLIELYDYLIIASACHIN